MSSRQLAALLAIAAAMTLCTLVAAAPSLDVRKAPTGTVVPNPSWTGPPGDPHAVSGQWIKDKRTGIEEWCTHELYDNIPGTGGSQTKGPYAIQGIAVNVAYGSTADKPILSFDVLATVTNDAAEAFGDWQPGANSHHESSLAQQFYSGTMYTTKLSASFAVDLTAPQPAPWSYPYQPISPWIVALDNDGLAWFCYTPGNPEQMQSGDYYVPTWDLGAILPSQSVTRTLKFTVPGGLSAADPRYNVIDQSYHNGGDMFLNRTTALKVDSWIDSVALDPGLMGDPYPTDPPSRAGDVSVFHNYGDEPRPRDWGDAPPQYPTMALNNGANHIQWNGFCLGQFWDAEGDGQPDPNALGDDNNPLTSPDDEDGVFWLPPYSPGQMNAKVNVLVTLPIGMNNAFLDAWIDFGVDGTWLTPGDQIATALPVVAGMNTVTFNIPATAIPGQTFTRFRLSSVGNLPPTGMATDGEVEDHSVIIEDMQPDYDFGDAPEGALAYPASGVIGQFPTCMQVGPAGFIQHTNFGAWFGPSVDFESDGNAGLCPMFNPNSYDKDECCQDGDAGLLFPAAYTIQGPPGGETVVPCSSVIGPLGLTCQTATWGMNADIHIHNWMPNHEPYLTAYVNVLMDWDQNGQWMGASMCGTGGAPEHVLVDFPIPPQYDGPLSALNPPSFLIGPNAGYVWTRFSITERPVGRDWTGEGSFEDGETEDYLLQVDEEIPPEFDFGDAPDQPYPTLMANGGAFHVAAPGFCLGAAIDTEADGQPDSNAMGDDNNPAAGPDDEDGVTFGPLLPGSNGKVTVTVTMPAGAAAFLDAWIDWNGDGSWATAGDQVLTAQPVVNGPNVFTVAVPATISGGTKTFARFRLSSNPQGLPVTGGYQDGEVEDYEVGIGYKWTQKPDLKPTGIDVKATEPIVLADDFLCTVSGPITDIHIWGSWLHDLLPGDDTGLVDPGLVTFRLSIHKDIPADDKIPYSRPGELLWYREFLPGSFVVHPYAEYLEEGEGWWDPMDLASYIFPGDHTVWQYDFFIKEEPFYQQGSQEEPIIYWLDLQAVPGGMNQAQFGWKTCIPDDRWNDDAVFGVGSDPEITHWVDMHYPDPHPLAPQSLDLAFALTGYAEERDWGDAPDGPYPTWAASNGANHTVVSGFCLGNLIDGEPNGQPNANATGDDITNLPDEDGVTLWPLMLPGQTTTIVVNASLVAGQPAFLDAWIDFGADGSWATPGDQIAFAMPVVVGPNPVTFMVPRTGVPLSLQTFARLRLSTCPNGLAFTGSWRDGEVEDYMVRIGPDHGSLTFSQAFAIRDHFWWRGDPDPYNEMLSLKVGTDLVEPVSWDSVTLSLSGGAAGDVNKIEVWLDNNASNTVDAGDTLIGGIVNPASPAAIALAGAVIPANSSVKALISYTLSPGAPVGNVYSFLVTGASGTGQISGLPADIFGLPIASCNKTVVPPPISIGQAKLLPVGSTVFLQGKICTAAFASWNLFYIEEPNRSAGIGVQFTGVSSPAVKDELVSLLGSTSLLNGSELTIIPTQITVGVSLLPSISPVGMNNKWTGGGMFGGQPAVFDDAPAGAQATGLSNVGMLVRTWGTVTWHDWAFTTPTVSGPFFWINDGSNLNDGLRLTPGLVGPGVACYYGFVGHPGSFPDIGEYWGVTGILRAIPNFGISGVGQPVRLLVPRSFPEDLNEYSTTSTP